MNIKKIFEFCKSEETVTVLKMVKDLYEKIKELFTSSKD